MTDNGVSTEARVRLDKWLWAARFFKTRALAVQAVEAGQVRVGDNERSKPSHALKVGDRVSIRKEGLSWNITVLGLSDRRLSATLAAGLYCEDEASKNERDTLLAQRRVQPSPRFPGRPTKKNRRALEEFLNEG